MHFCAHLQLSQQLDSIVSGVVIDATPNVVNSSSSKTLDCTDTIMLYAPLYVVTFSIRTLDCTDTCYMQQHTFLLMKAGTLSPAKIIT